MFTPPVQQLIVDHSIDFDNNPIQEGIFFKPLTNLNYTQDDESILPSNLLNNNDVIDEQSREEPTDNDGASPFKGMSLKDFEAQRKMIEEQNKHKKDLLYKAIEQQ